MNNEILEVLIQQITDKWGDKELGAYSNGNWFSPADVIQMIKDLDEEY